MNFSITTYKDQYIPEIVSFWNETFSDRRNFFPIDAELFRNRITNVETNMEKFEARNFLLAVDQEESKVHGFIHIGIHPEEFCRTWYGNEWEGGVQGYVGMIAVHPDSRENGVGTALWEHGMEKLDHCENIILDGQCINPYYGNSLGPFQPLWGTTEGISISPDQRATLSFFSRRGFKPRYAGLSLEVSVDDANLESHDQSEGRIQILEDEYPALDNPAELRLPYPDAEDYFVTQFIKEDQTAGLLSVYPMKHLDERKWGVYEFQVHESYQGEGYGKELLDRTIQELQDRNVRVCETFALKDLSEDAISLYKSRGFEKKSEWVIY